MVESIPLLRHHLSQWIEATNLSQQCQNVVQERRQQLTLVKEAMTMGRNHTLYSVIKRYGTYKRAKEAREKAKQALRDKMEECQKHISMHNVSVVCSLLMNREYYSQSAAKSRRQVLIYLIALVSELRLKAICSLLYL